MPAPFQRLTVEQFSEVLNAFSFRRRINSVHMHHTWRPNHAQWRGHDSMVGMWRFHTQDRGFSDIAQHLTIDPEGLVWTGRNWNASPASMLGNNGTQSAGPFMFEIVGDFDVGRDPFHGAQRRAVLDVITLVQLKFGLPPETLVFHNQAADKSCPGTSIDYGDFLKELHAHRAAHVSASTTRVGGRPRGKLPLADSALASSSLVQRTVRLIDTNDAEAGSMNGAASEELGCGHLHSAEFWTEGAIQSRSAARGSSLPTAEQIDALRPYVLNLRMGQFSSDGLMTSAPSDVDMIVHEHVRAAAQAAAAKQETLRVVLYAHGGLVKESAGLGVALTQVGWWRDNGIYPIHFVWETGLFETIKTLLERARSPLGKRGLGDVITDRLTDPLLERAARALQAERIWGGMKASARLANEAGGGAHVLLSALSALIREGLPLELHAVGHSAGSIFHAHLLKAACDLGLSFRTLQLMAPAVRTDVFAQLTQPLLGKGKGVDALTVYTMRRDFERDDNCAGIYRKSLLYFVSAACEDRIGTPLLGLEDSIRADEGLRSLFGLGQRAGDSAEVVWSRSVISEGRSASWALRHGDFDNDRPTMNSVLRRVLALDDAAPLSHPFPSGSRSVGDPWRDTVDWPPEWAADEQVVQPDVVSGSGVRPDAVATKPTNACTDRPSASGRRVALCVGIDNYPSAPLSGCHNDARLWQRTLQALGFQATVLLDPDRESLVDALHTLVTGTRAGDEVVFQFAGHGTYVDDVDGDEAAGDSPGRDEALCPLDFEDGAFLIDDDVGRLIDRMAPGARLTMFMDCCHSGTVSRMGGPRAALPPRGGRPRFIRSTPALNHAHRKWRAQLAVSSPEASPRRAELLFTACTSLEVAWESEGQGEFTLRATRLLDHGLSGLTPRQFQQRLTAAFGPQPRQNPQLEGPVERLDAPLFAGPGE